MQEWEEKVIEKKKAREEGEMFRLISQVQKKIQKNKSLKMIAEELEETEDGIRPVYMLLKEKPDACKEDIYQQLRKVL